MPIALITGATDGLGRHVARDLAGEGWTVLVHGRSRSRAEDVVPGARVYVADLSSLAEVRRLADEVLANEPRLDVLVNNAGVGSAGEREESADGLELRFAVNYLAHFVLTLRLLELLRRSAPSRIVNVASAGQAAIDFGDVQLERGWSGGRAYAQSKLAQIMFTFSLAERLEGTGVTVNALHPATYMHTKMVLAARGSSLSTVEEGAEATERLITTDAGTGRYFNGLREARADPQAYDADARERLWALSERLAG
ncbi:SDR family NAD(P)-dependent oxidoreductase [Candidatus Solirubrobacter pratensis]|uniref:SDR family NAD(P)-dependent oxidoreductase n=1 Tax=Candidatus Solirubrobacter pratensis TaxID=1298857 RepID=UPI00040C4A79|nr:SDR family NAD(P)-dependent oxidoreductase [Candidatus Solirubrobacter pratensis]